jgi:CubicO group peptidase (beta-lactamase class C family)
MMKVLRAFMSANTRTNRRKTSVLGFVLASVLFSVGLVGVPKSVEAKPVISTTKDEDWKTGPLPDGVKKKDLDALVKTAMGAPDNKIRVRSVLITINDKIVYERYHPLDNKDSFLDTFSVSKSFVSTVVGMLVDDGRLSLDQPAPVAAWSGLNDPRSAITIRNLLHMSSGLTWKEEYTAGDSSTLAMLFAPVASDYAIALPLEVKPGTQFEYNSGNSAILMRIITDTLGGTPQAESYIKKRLLNPLGIKKVVYQRDSSGRIVGFMGINMTARDQARFGLLYLRNGVWGKKKVISPEWVKFSSTPSPTFQGYAGHWWTHYLLGSSASPGDFTALGYYGQYVTVSRSKRMVMVINTAFEGTPTEQTVKARNLVQTLYALFPAK